MKESKSNNENKNYSVCEISTRKSLEDEFGSRGLKNSHRSEAELMIINDFLNYLGNFLDYSDVLYSTILPIIEVHTLGKTTRMVAEGSVGTYGFWLQSGYGRYYSSTTDQEGLPAETTIDFCKPGKIIVIPEGSFNGSISDFNLQVARGTVVIPLSKECIERLKLKVPEVEELGNKNVAFDKQNSLPKLKMLKMKPRERYHEFLRIFGVEIEQYFAVKHIASCLGLQPSFLSRLRGENFKR